jgi:hypothetical protein
MENKGFSLKDYGFLSVGGYNAQKTKPTAIWLEITQFLINNLMGIREGEA